MATPSLRFWRLRLAALAVAGLVTGCSVLSPKPDLARDYILHALTAKISPTPTPDPTLALAVFPADVDGYLDRPQIVTHPNGSRVSWDEYHRWAEPLDTGFSRVLAEDIGLFADSTHVAAFPLPPGYGQEFEVYTQVEQFDGVPGGIVALRVSWRITGLGGKPSYSDHETTFTRRAATTADPADGYVAALNELIGDLARDVVSALPQARAAKAAQSGTTP